MLLLLLVLRVGGRYPVDDCLWQRHRWQPGGVREGHLKRAGVDGHHGREGVRSGGLRLGRRGSGLRVVEMLLGRGEGNLMVAGGGRGRGWGVADGDRVCGGPGGSLGHGKGGATPRGGGRALLMDLGGRARRAAAAAAAIVVKGPGGHHDQDEEESESRFDP